MAQLYPVEVRLTRKWSAPSIKHARYGGSLAAMVARGSFNTVSGTASCHYSMQECWSFPRPRTLIVRHYREMEARLSAAGAFAIEQPTPLVSTESKRAFRRAMEAFRPPPFQRASRPAPAASRLQPAPPVGLLARVGEGVQDFSVFLNELDPCQVRPCRHRNVLPGRLAPKYLPQQLVEPPVVPLAEQALMLRV